MKFLYLLLVAVMLASPSLHAQSAFLHRGQSGLAAELGAYTGFGGHYYAGSFGVSIRDIADLSLSIAKNSTMFMAIPSVTVFPYMTDSGQIGSMLFGGASYTFLDAATGSAYSFLAGCALQLPLSEAVELVPTVTLGSLSFSSDRYDYYSGTMVTDVTVSHPVDFGLPLAVGVSSTELLTFTPSIATDQTSTVVSFSIGYILRC